MRHSALQERKRTHAVMWMSLEDTMLSEISQFLEKLKGKLRRRESKGASKAVCGVGRTGPYYALGTELLFWDRNSPRHYVEPCDFI